jgi:hypothetical protein
MTDITSTVPSPVKGRLIEQMRLDNGLVLELYDLSRPVAGNRWMVGFAARIEVAVEPDLFSDLTTSNLSFEDLRRVVGEKAVYYREKVRNFIDAKQKDEVFGGLKEHFLKTNLGYLSSAQFPRKLILRKYFDAQHPERIWRRQ